VVGEVATYDPAVHRQAVLMSVRAQARPSRIIDVLVQHEDCAGNSMARDQFSDSLAHSQHVVVVECPGDPELVVEFGCPTG
jgi:TPP-dependent indolepyruvate ferredoxin oxidoreductase alpha subunit